MENLEGFKFDPRETQIINYFLKKKILDPVQDVYPIKETDILKFDPWELPGEAGWKSEEGGWYFFWSPRSYHTSGRTERRTKKGAWKKTGRDHKIKDTNSKQVIGVKKILVFSHRNPDSADVQTKWVMHEYHSFHFSPSKKPYVVCRIMRKHNIRTSTCEDGPSNTEENYTENNIPKITSFYVEPSSFVESKIANEIATLDKDYVSISSILQVQDSSDAMLIGTLSQGKDRLSHQLDDSLEVGFEDFVELADLLAEDESILNQNIYTRHLVTHSSSVFLREAKIETENLVGFKFEPKETQIINYFLNKKILDPVQDVYPIKETDILKFDPWELPGEAGWKSEEGDCYFFWSPRSYRRSGRTERRTKKGAWKKTGRDHKIKDTDSKQVIGVKKILVFSHRNPDSVDVQTKWVMHEYHSFHISPNKTSYVVCRIMKKHSNRTSTCEDVHNFTENNIPEINSFYVEPSSFVESEIANEVTTLNKDPVSISSILPVQDSLDAKLIGTLSQGKDRLNHQLNSSLEVGLEDFVELADLSAEDDRVLNHSEGEPSQNRNSDSAYGVVDSISVQVHPSPNAQSEAQEDSKFPDYNYSSTLQLGTHQESRTFKGFNDGGYSLDSQSENQIKQPKRSSNMAWCLEHMWTDPPNLDFLK